jgi:hypothetical protein
MHPGAIYTATDSQLSPDLDGTIHFIQPVEPYDGVVGEDCDAFFNYYCRQNWFGLRYNGGKCSLTCDFRFFKLANLEATASLTPRQQRQLSGLREHYQTVHAGFDAAKRHFALHGALYNRYASPPYEESDRLELLKCLGGQSEQFSCNWAQLNDMPLTRLSPEHSVPQSPDGRDFIFVGELRSFHYLCGPGSALCCDLLLFYDPVSQISLATFEWS